MRLTKEEMGRRIREGVKAVIGQVLEGGDAKGHGGLGFPALPGHGPALGRGRKTHKNRDLTGHGPSPPPVPEVDHLEEQVHLQGAALHCVSPSASGKKMKVV